MAHAGHPAIVLEGELHRDGLHPFCVLAAKAAMISFTWKHLEN